MRKTLSYTVSDDGRDNGKVFFITEMPSTKAEKWAIKAFLAMAKGGVELPEGIEHSGFSGIAKVGLQLLLQIPYELAEPLLDEMLECVQIRPNPKDPSIVRPLMEEDIEEVKTRFVLRKEVFALHTGFFQTASPLTSELAQGIASGVSLNIKTSRKVSRS